MSYAHVRQQLPNRGFLRNHPPKRGRTVPITVVGAIGGTPARPERDRSATLRLMFEMSIGHLEKLISMPIADLASVNIYESEREQSRIIRGQFCGERPVGAIFRGAL
jgi:hypothetical protein